MGTFSQIAAAIMTTITVTGLSFLLGSLLGIPLVIGINSHIPIVSGIARSFVDFVRVVPPLVWLFLIFFGLAGVLALPPYPAAVVGLGVVSGAYLAEVYRSGILTIRRGQHEAARAIGLRRADAWRLVLIPQALSVILPGAASWAVALLKETSVVSIIGVADITFLAVSEAQRAVNSLEVFVIAAILYLALSFPIALFARWLDSRMSRALAR